MQRLTAGPGHTFTGFFDPAIPPVMTVQPGDTVSLATQMLYDDQLRPGMTLEELDAVSQRYRAEGSTGHTLTGPIEVAGARPGDVLQIDILKLIPRPYAVNYVRPGRQKAGFLPEDFPEGRIGHVSLDITGMTAEFAPGILVPLRPFMGIMAVAPGQPGRRSTAPPGEFGGNLDCKELVAGTTLYLPVFVPGALFVTGDAHAAQGDGEVCITALETAMEEAVFRLNVRRDFPLDGPLIETPERWIIPGFNPDLAAAAQMSLRRAISFLTGRTGLDALDAYRLISVAGDVRVTQLVNGVKGIHTVIPKNILPAEK